MRALKTQLPWFFRQAPACIQDSDALLAKKLAGVEVIGQSYAMKRGGKHIYVLNGFQCGSEAKAFPEFKVNEIAMSSRVRWSLVRPKSPKEIVKVQWDR